MQEGSNLTFAMEILDKRKRCSNCYHNRTGHCSMYSCNCANAVFNRAETPPLWISYEDGEKVEAKMLGKTRPV